MPIAEISHAIQEIDFLRGIRESPMAYPVILSTHLTCIALFGGMVLMTNLRLLGVSMMKVPLSEMLDGMRIWKRLGLATIITCGLLLAGSELDKYYANPFFHLKLTLILMAALHPIVFRNVYRNARDLDKLTVMPGMAKLAGWTSIIIYVGILSAGRWIAYYEPPERGGNAQVMQQAPEVRAAVYADASRRM